MIEGEVVVGFDRERAAYDWICTVCLDGARSRRVWADPRKARAAANAHARTFHGIDVKAT